MQWVWGSSICVLTGHWQKLQNYDVFLSLKIVFIIYAAFHLSLHCLPKNMYLFIGIQKEKVNFILVLIHISVCQSTCLSVSRMKRDDCFFDVRPR